MPLTGIAFFAALFVMAVVNVSRPNVHNRLLLLATVAIEPPPVLVTIVPGVVADALIPALLHDRKHLGRVHPTFWIAGAALIASQFLRGPLAANRCGRWPRPASPR